MEKKTQHRLKTYQAKIVNTKIESFRKYFH